MFEQMRNDPNVQFAGMKPGTMGAKFYVLQSQQNLMKIAGKDGWNGLGLVTVYFDASTYKQVGYRMTNMEKDGQEILLGFQENPGR